MSEKRSTPAWQKKLWELGNPKVRHQEVKRRAYRTVTSRYLWGIAAVFFYFLLCAYGLGGDGGGSSDNSGIYILILGAVVMGGLGAFFAPRLNEALERLLPSGRRKKEEHIPRKSHRSRSTSSGSGARSEKGSSRSKSPSEKADS